MELTITKRDGVKEVFNADRINRSIERAALGLMDPISKVTQIATDTHVTIYDGITTEELDLATINAAVQNIKEDSDYDRIATRLLLKTVYKHVLGDYGEDPAQLEKVHKEHFADYVKKGIENKIFDERMEKNFDLPRLSAALDISRDELFIYAGLSTLLNRYSVKDINQKAFETPQYCFMRVAMGNAYNEKDPTEWAIKFYEKMSRHEYIAGGSTNIHAGTPSPALSNCFLLEIHDNMEHISKSVMDVMMLSKASGGLGASITKLRAMGSPLSSNNTTSSGPTPFAKIIDVAIRAIMRGGKKKGALCFYMENWHYDFPEFIEWKHNAGDDHMRMRTADTAAYISDEFMKRLEAKADWYMFDPKETKDLNELYGKAFSARYNEYIKMAEEGKLRMWKKVPTTEQWRAILVALQTTSHPWITFKDPINLRALNNNTGTIHMSNLCTEICLPQDKENIAVCNLASINIAAHLKKKQIDWQKLEESARLAIRQLDNLIDINVLPVAEARKSDQENRAIGLGVMGFSDAIEQLGIPYDSPHAYDFTDKIFEFISYMAIDESANLAQERGSYTHFSGSGWSQGMVPVDTMARLEEERGVAIETDKKSKQNWLDWDSLRAKVKNGMRNATLMAVAPNANIGLVAGTTPGIDPRFAQVFSRNKISGKYLDINHNLVTELKNMNLWDMVKTKIIELQGDISSITEIPAHIRDIYKTSFSVSPYAFIEVAARAQKWVDQALSRNMYLDDRDMEKTMDIYTAAWRKGVKTTYYLHMKPRHTAEQSTVAVNKSAKLGKIGFASVFKKEEAVTGNQELVSVAAEVVKEEVIEKEQEQIIDQKKAFTLPVEPVKVEPIKVEPLKQISEPVFAKVQTQLPTPHAEGQHYQEKIIDGKTYRVHMPTDPQEQFLCDGCQ
ncbi:MAG: ribonucleoside-diphosphate reductase subunit alpha [Candidatus Staskawiczbacteria bacterium RIFCSPHIGHO2_02_FULL_43_16]|uniref:Ribonucleoside-diphosphate reductase n=1 Tax=Candidatus Staskawiczbacteria bacterium RIFCSPHIGHO2_01_FULL_41_41 TaxID=1802203 RepID=A0A1G2HVD0_9BACT|nr:MAG: ribonucleoside-diphosphate reductase subunit alpha [Candidatus Staskawiczbacteria bacterium RIFCSPHIGHO2_01_FULL_41_41]OGZ68168.1 MAG: ribonucleoside-diphosphate reductase subunit alpha [Candidatus Staskawiczbacteria bacterium RIFCSPHIGHO2_02_FULL_43_16]OGZ74958.1 MAG: ribonucleoside-diphosphate reductase subunit alpha [Candidatus Staskawiczbacteria bacterium RIFCSPLOWO2_01_FULL_43_17b]